MLEPLARAPQAHPGRVTLTWNSKFVCSRNFWFMVSANLLIALRKTLEERSRSPGHLSMLPQASLPIFQNEVPCRGLKDPKKRSADPPAHTVGLGPCLPCKKLRTVCLTSLENIFCLNDYKLMAENVCYPKRQQLPPHKQANKQHIVEPYHLQKTITEILMHIIFKGLPRCMCMNGI